MSLKYLVTSDIHLGHRRTPTSHITNSFRKSILNSQNADIDILFIAGDLFDRLIESNSRDLLLSIDLLEDILSYCNKNSIKLRVLEGTPGHDWQLPQLLVKLNDLRKEQYKADLIYHKVLSIEHIPEHNLYVLYVPDEWTNDHAKLEKEITDKLSQLSISKVDIAIMHGQFRYQVAGIPYKGFYFKEEFFLPIVKNLIHIGHYHTHTHFDRIVANGSLERLRHNEEEDKGYVTVNNSTWTFHVNKNAYIYKTISVTARTTINSLERTIRQYPANSYICLKMSPDHPFNLNYQDIKLKFLSYHIEKKVKSIDSTNSTEDILSDTELQQLDTFTIDTDLQKTLKEIVTIKYDLNTSELEKLTNYLKVFDNLSVDEFI